MVTIICVGKKHESIYEQAIAHFEGRIKPFVKLTWILLPHSSLDGNDARSDESERILARVGSGSHVILFDETGENTTSPEMAQKIEQAQNTSKDIVFIIGGAYGVNGAVKERANFTVAFGKAVFPHQLMRVMVLEQIYRAHAILAGSKYHHD